MLPPEIGVDLIIGGHSHTLLEQPERVGDILIAQVGSGTEFIGRFDLTINMDSNDIHDFSWQAVPIDADHCPQDPVMDQLLAKYQEEVDSKYNTVISRLPHEMEHGDRFRETELGNLFADILRYQLGVDLVFIASGSIRKPKLGQLVTRSDLMELFPYDEAMISFSVKGDVLEAMLGHLMRSLYQEGSREFYQWNAELRVQVDDQGQIREILMKGQPLDYQADYRIAMQDYHVGILADTFGISREELAQTGRIRVVSTSAQDNIVEYFRKHKIPRTRRDGRISLESPLAPR